MPAVNALLPGRIVSLPSLGCAAPPFRRGALLVRRRVHISEHGPTLVDDSNPRKNKIELPRAPNITEDEPPSGLEDANARYLEKGSLPEKRLLAKPATHSNNNNCSQEAAPAVSASGFGPKVMRQVLSLALPALGTVLADPLMSLVDTACVGQISSVELAALGPNTAIFNFVFQLFTFLGLSTANTIASNSIRAEDLTAREVQDRQDYSEKIMCFSATLAACIGMGTTVMLFAAGPVLLRALGSSPEIIPFALPYLRIRALASPAVMFTIAAQGACLGQEDMWTPLKVILVSGLINLIGDMHLILNLKMGTVGAALATTAAQYAGAAFFLWYLIKGGSKGAGLKLRWKGLPTVSALKPMLDVGQILLARTGATMIGYTAITSAATVLGTVAIAAHQVTLQVFWLLSYFPEPFSLTAQTLIAKSKGDRDHVRGMSRLLLRLGTYTGAGLALVLGAVFSFAPFIFSSDPTVVSTVQGLVPQAMVSLFIVSISMMCEGISIGSGHMKHLPSVMTSSMVSALAWVYASQVLGKGLGSVWWGLVAFFAVRTGLHAVNIWSNWKTSPFGLYSAEDDDPPKQSSIDQVMNPQLA